MLPISPGPSSLQSPPAGPLAPEQRSFSPFFQALPLRNVAIALVLGGAAAAGLNPWFSSPFVELLVRTLCVAGLLLLAYAAAHQWVPRALPSWLPAWLWPVAVVAVSALPATVLVYAIVLRGDVLAIFRPGRVLGMFFIACSGLVLGLLAATAAGVRERLANARATELRFALERSQLEKQAMNARLALLQSQIQPHFLFNTLGNVQALVESGSPRAADVLRSLIVYLRAAMPRLQDGSATLEQELTLVRAYLALMQMRMPDRLEFDINADAKLLSLAFPPMALLTLVENAVRHAIDPLERGGRISVSAAQGQGRWWVQVTDDGKGMDAHARPGTGLANLRERLLGIYGSAAALELEECSPQGLYARIVVPPVGTQ